MGAGAGAGFAGRRGELARFARALAGETRLLLVVGDAGVGKTRFVAEALRAAVSAGEGVIAAWGGCLPLAEQLPLLPVAQALGELSRRADGRLLAEALSAAPAYARAEMARLVPGLEPDRSGDGGDAPGAGGAAGGWQRDRLFSAVADVLAVVAARSAVSVVIEDVHWADTATLDCLTYLLRARGVAGLTVVATCRSDEAPLDELVVSWLAHVRGSGPVAEIRLGPLSRAEIGDQVAGLAGGPVPDGLADEVFARAEGNPFFTEQLVTAALADGPDGGAGSAGSNPDGAARGGERRGCGTRVARAAWAGCRPRCRSGWRSCCWPGRAGAARTGRRCSPHCRWRAGRWMRQPWPMSPGYDPAAVRRGLRELAAARLLAEPGARPAVSVAGPGTRRAGWPGRAGRGTRC